MQASATCQGTLVISPPVGAHLCVKGMLTHHSLVIFQWHGTSCTGCCVIRLRLFMALLSKTRVRGCPINALAGRCSKSSAGV